VTIGEVISRGYYIGSNASYNIKKMITNEYLQQTPSDFDKRAAYLRVTEKGLDLYYKLDSSIKNHLSSFDQKYKKELHIEDCIDFLKSVENFWQDILLRRI
jgi:DNA-binding MarR family transcriptional regulator